MVWMMRTGRSKKFLKVVFGQPSLPLVVTFGSCYELLTRVVSSLVIVAIAGHHGNATGSALLPLLTTLSAFPGTFDGGLGGCGLATIGGRSRVT
jgi:hypothetical protein